MSASINTCYGRLSGRALAIFACVESANRYSLAVLAKRLMNFSKTLTYCKTKSIVEFDRELSLLERSIRDEVTS